MSTSDKLTYLNGTKQALKESINNIGGDITSETTFREYAQELQDIYDNLPKTTGESSNLSLNTLKGKMNIIPKGDTQQTQYSGYNLLPTTINQSTYNGITIQKQSDGSYKATGTATGNAILYILNESDNITLPIGNYYISGCPSGGTGETYRLVISVGGTLYGEYGSGRAITTSASGTLSAYIYVGTGTTINLTYYPMLVSGSTQKTYEPFVGGTASPNPTYPQNIEVVTGTQEVKVENVNKLPYASESTNTINDMVFTSNGKGTYILNGTASATSYYDYSISEYTIKSTDYLYLKNTETNSNISVALLNGNTQIMYTGPSQTNRIVSLSSYVGSTIDTLRIRTTAQTLSNFTLKPMIAETTTQTDFVEHQEQTQTISLGDIELCKIGNYQDYLYKTSGKNKCNITSTEGWLYSAGLPDSTNTSMVIDSFDSNSIQYHSNTNAYLEVLTNQIQLKPNTQYTITFSRTSTATNNQFFIYNYVQGSSYSINFRDNNQNVFEKTFTTDSNGIIVLGFGFGNVTGTAKVSNIMLNEGSTALPYEPYGTGKWYKKENVAKINCKNTDTWYKSSSTAVDKFYMRTPYPYYQPIIYDNIGNKCNYFTYKLGTSDVGKFNLGDNSGYLSIFFNYSTYGTTTLNDFKTWVGTIDLTCYLPLQVANDIQITNTTLIEQLDNLEKLKSYNGTTNINSSGSLPMILNISAIKGES